MQKEYYTNAGSDRSRDISEYLVSVIVPIYKVEEYLEECLISITEQTYHNLDIILVDDGSPDRCPEICDSYAKKDARIKVIHKKMEVCLTRGTQDLTSPRARILVL